jgi:hypothetical protein
MYKSEFVLTPTVNAFFDFFLKLRAVVLSSTEPLSFGNQRGKTKVYYYTHFVFNPYYHKMQKAEHPAL